nr:MAG TPA: hypothetical protein [Caudoviricetes sp.]
MSSGIATKPASKVDKPCKLSTKEICQFNSDYLLYRSARFENASLQCIVRYQLKSKRLEVVSCKDLTGN